VAAREAAGRSVAETVAARNQASAAQAEAFRKAGWTMVATPAPDPRLLALDPSLLPGREDELRVQIASTVPSPELAPRLRRIALEAHEPATRVAAVEALGRIGTPDAQAELLALLPQLPEEDAARRQIVPLLRPSGLDDPRATQLASLLDAPALTPAEKKQLAFTLALVGLRDGMKLPDGAVSPAAKQLIDQMTALAQRGSGGTEGGAP
jgi:HEAT repeat protein